MLYNLRGWEEGKGMGGLARFGGLGPCTRARSSAPELNESKTHEMEWMNPLSFYCEKYWVDVSCIYVRNIERMYPLSFYM